MNDDVCVEMSFIYILSFQEDWKFCCLCGIIRNTWMYEGKLTAFYAVYHFVVSYSMCYEFAAGECPLEECNMSLY